MSGLTQDELEDNNSYNPIDRLFADKAPTFGHSAHNELHPQLVPGRRIAGLIALLAALSLVTAALG